MKALVHSAGFWSHLARGGSEFYKHPVVLVGEEVARLQQLVVLRCVVRCDNHWNTPEPLGVAVLATRC